MMSGVLDMNIGSLAGQNVQQTKPVQFPASLHFVLRLSGWGGFHDTSSFTVSSGI